MKVECTRSIGLKKVTKTSILKNIKCIQENKKIQIMISYKNNKTYKLIMKWSRPVLYTDSSLALVRVQFSEPSDDAPYISRQICPNNSHIMKRLLG